MSCFIGSTIQHAYSLGSARKDNVPIANRWDEKAGLLRDAVGSQVIDVLEAQAGEANSGLMHNTFKEAVA
jgi:hypothetical protein